MSVAAPFLQQAQGLTDLEVMSGSMTVTPDGDDEPVTLKAGDTILIPRGWSGAWEIHETLRKLYVIF